MSSAPTGCSRTVSIPEPAPSPGRRSSTIGGATAVDMLPCMEPREWPDARAVRPLIPQALRQLGRVARELNGRPERTLNLFTPAQCLQRPLHRPVETTSAPAPMRSTAMAVPAQAALPPATTSTSAGRSAAPAAKAATVGRPPRRATTSSPIRRAGSGRRTPPSSPFPQRTGPRPVRSTSLRSS